MSLIATPPLQPIHADEISAVTSEKALPQTWGYRLKLTGAVVLMLLGVAILATVLGGIHHRDFITYWSSAQLMAAHHNPYDSADILLIEKATGELYHDPFIMRNPPTMLFLVAPLSFCNVWAGTLLWTVASLLACLVSLRLAAAPSKYVPVIAFLFAPLLASIIVGQSSVFLLLGVVLFFQFAPERPWAAGVALVLLSIKPHLFLPFWPVLLVDCWYRRQWRTLAAMVAAVLAAMGFAAHVDPHVLGHYLVAARAEHVEMEFRPDISSALHFLIAPKVPGLQFLPSLLAIGWGCWFWFRNRNPWDWRQHGALLVAAGALTSPYSWPSDQVLFLPAILSGLCVASRVQKYVLLAFSLFAMFLIMRSGVLLTSPLLLWTAPAWMLWCLWTQSRKKLQL